MNRSVLIALIGFAAALAAVVLFVFSQHEDRAALTQATAPAPVSQTMPEPAAGKPSFDVVRIGEHGDAVIAGRALPKAEVAILDGGKVIGRVTADARGEWVFVPDVAMPPGARELTLEAHNPDGTVTRSGAPVILVVPEREGGPALAVKRLPGGGGRVLQGAGGATSGDLSLDMVDHEAGTLFVGGRAKPGTVVQVYLDNRLVGRATAGEDGGWQVSAPEPAKPAKHLRVDEVDGHGKVLARVEVSYDAPLAGAAPAPGTIVVQPGNSLWRIARGLYGKGTAFTVLYQANKTQIRDPDLIYPGQVFTIPQR